MLLDPHDLFDFIQQLLGLDLLTFMLIWFDDPLDLHLLRVLEATELVISCDRLRLVVLIDDHFHHWSQFDFAHVFGVFQDVLYFSQSVFDLINFRPDKHLAQNRYKQLKLLQGKRHFIDRYLLVTLLNFRLGQLYFEVPAKDVELAQIKRLQLGQTVKILGFLDVGMLSRIELVDLFVALLLFLLHCIHPGHLLQVPISLLQVWRVSVIDADSGISDDRVWSDARDSMFAPITWVVDLFLHCLL